MEIYYIEDNRNIIGVIFSLSGKDNIQKFLQENNIKIDLRKEKVAQLSCFHIMKNLEE